jgi:hypothetical protein
MRQISHWRCEDHPTNLKKIISAGRYRAPLCDWQTPLTDSWPCSRPMVPFSPPPEGADYSQSANSAR